MCDSFREVVQSYIDEHLKGRPSFQKMSFVASQWVLHCASTPTRAQLLQRQQSICQGHYEKGATKANTELALIRAACRWGIYQERWTGGDPTVGIRKMKSPKRTRIGKHEELKLILGYFSRTASVVEIRDRALYGLMLFTGCRPGEARMTRLDAITPYGQMGSWQKGKTKNGQTQELPLPAQYMPWLAAWKAIRPMSTNPYLFPGQTLNEPVTVHAVKLRWHEMRLILGIHGLWNYDLRRTLVNVMGNELGYDMHTIKAIINHYEGSALGHYYFKSFDSLTKPIQAYANWLMHLQARSAPVILATSTRIRAPHPGVMQ
jgi:integrase/recombinase XerD